MIQKGYKMHLETAFSPTAVCGIIYPRRHTQRFKLVNCKRCRVTIEGRKDIAHEEEG